MSRESDLAKLVGQSRLAYERGARVFAAKLKVSAWNPPDHGEIEMFGESIDAVEAEGWRLDQWAIAADSGGAACGYPVFRRADAGIQDRV